MSASCEMPSTCGPTCPAACGHCRLTSILPLVDELLVPTARADGLVVAVADERGLLRYVQGDHRTRTLAEDAGFAVGEDWSEPQAGTNAPGRALALGTAATVHREEHTRPEIHAYSCTAVPLRDPGSGSVLGVLDLTGGAVAADPHCLALVQATAAAAERELRLQVSEPPGPPAATAHPAVARLRLVHDGRPCLEVCGTAYPLTERHAELLLLLATHEGGLRGEQIAALLSPEQAPSATVRVELLRLRRRLEEIPAGPCLTSRPYRLTGPVLVDALQVTEHLGRGEHDAALSIYRGPALRRAGSARVLELLRVTSVALREAMLSDASSHSLLRYLQLPEAHDDPEPWRVALRVLPPRAPQRAMVLAHLEGLER